MDLLERDEAGTLLESCLSDAIRGWGRLVLVSGEAGIGKTSVAREFTSAYSDDAHVWWGACDALTTPRPLGPLYDIARAAGGELAALMASDATRYERFSGFLDALRSPLRPVIAIIEDVHWADDTTRDLVVFVARRVAETNAVVVVTFRDDEVGARHPLRSVLGQLATHDAVRRLSLPRLTSAAVAELAGSSGSAEQVYETTGGNPFFVTEVLAAGSDAVPVTVADAVLARAARLSAAGRAVLDAAAIVPDRAEIALISAIAGGAGGFGECADHGLLIPERNAVRFRHELARRAVEQAIQPSRASELHARALAHLAGQTGTDPARLAYHSDQAGDRDAVLEFASVAAERASRLGAHHQAVVHYESALRYADALPAVDRAELLERYSRESAGVNKYADAIAAVREAVEIWQHAGNIERLGRALGGLSEALWSSGRGSEANEMAHRAVGLLEGRGDSAALGAALGQLAALHMLARRMPEAFQLGSRAADLAERFGDTLTLSRTLNVVGSSLWFSEPERAEEFLVTARDVAVRAGDDVNVARALTNLGSGAGEARLYAIAERWLTEAINWCSRRDMDANCDYGIAWLSRTEFEQGRWLSAGSRAAAAAAAPGVISRIVGLTILGRLRTRRGDPDAAGPLNEAWQLAGETGDLQRLWPVAAGRAEAAWLSGKPELVPSLVSDTHDLAVELNHMWAVDELAFWLWRAGALDVAPTGAASPYARQVGGDWRAAALGWQEIGCPYEQAFALADSEDPDDLRAALEILGGLGANPLADRVAAQLRSLGIRDLPRRPSRETLENPAGLTERELEVLTLLGEGNTNPDIAAMLHISPRTVGHHVSAILAKLDVHDRRDAVRVARQRDIMPAGPGG